MAIAFDNTTPGTSHGATLTIEHTVAAGSDMILFYAETGHQSMPLSGVTWNGDALTSLYNYNGDNGTYQRVWYIVNPDTGTHNLVATCAKADHWHQGVVASYSGAKQTDVPDASDFTIKDGGTPVTSCTDSITTTVDNCWILWILNSGNGYSMTAGDNTYKREQTGGAADLAYFDTNAAQTPAGSKSMAVTFSSQVINGGIIISFAPSAPATSRKTIKGLAVASVKTYKGLATASVKTKKGLA